MRIHHYAAVLLMSAAPLLNVAQNSSRSPQQENPPTEAEAGEFVDAATPNF